MEFLNKNPSSEMNTTYRSEPYFNEYYNQLDEVHFIKTLT